jgi:hypothetical protein
MQMKTLWAALAVAGLSAACGGGGGDSAPADNSTSVTLSGVAAKGVLQNAVVSVHPIKADGSADTGTVLATIQTNDKGEYVLPSFVATRGAPYVVRVSAVSATRALDEVTGAPVALPDGFSLRTLVLAPATGPAPTTAHVTPFSELAAAAATGASGGITLANATQALSNVRQLLGFDPTIIKPATIQEASGPEQQALAVMLTAVSKLANDSAIGCATGDLGARTQCVVQTLASASTLDSTKPGTVSGVDLAAALVTSAQAVAADPVLTAGSTVTPGTITTVTGNLQGDGKPAQPGNVTAIAAATQLFTGLRSDFQALFSQDGVSSIATGAANVEAFKFKQAMEGVQDPVELLVKDAGAILTGIDLYNDFLAGRSPNNRHRGDSDYASIAGPAVSCSIYATSAMDVLATTPSEANFIGCRARYEGYVMSIDGAWRASAWHHGFSLTPGANNTFTYSSQAVRTYTCPVYLTNCTPSSTPLSTQPSMGTVGTTLTNGRITGFTLKGDLPGAWEYGGTEKLMDRHAVDIQGTRSIDARNMSITTFSGGIESLDEAGNVRGKLTIKSGSTTEIPMSWDAEGNLVSRDSPAAVEPAGGDIGAGAIELVWATPTAEFAGSLALGASTWDKSLTTHTPTQITLAGSLRNLSGGVASEFLAGSLTAQVTGYGSYDAQAGDSASNFFTTAVSFTGSVTAPSRPKLELTFSGSQASYEESPASVTLQYRSIVSGTPKMVIGVVATRQADGDYSTKLTEAASNLSMTWADGAEEADLMVNGTEVVGRFNQSTKVLTFTDKTFISLDIGL